MPLTSVSRRTGQERLGNDDLVTTARTYTHVVTDERELDYAAVLR
jgi:hypothetical protein